MEQMERRGVLLVMGTALISGVGFFVSGLGIKDFDPALFTWLRSTLAAVALLGLVAIRQELAALRGLTARDWGRLVAIGLIGGAISFLFFFQNLALLSTANVSFLQKTLFIWVALLAAPLLGEHFGRRLWYVALLLLLGNALLLRPYASGISFRVGDGLVLLATLFWAGDIILSKYVLRTVPPRIVALVNMVIGSLFILGLLIATGRLAGLGQLTLPHLGWLALTALFPLGYVLTWYAGLRTIRATTAVGILFLGSPVATLLTALQGGTVVSGLQWLGIGLLLAGVVILLRSR